MTVRETVEAEDKHRTIDVIIVHLTKSSKRIRVRNKKDEKAAVYYFLLWTKQELGEERQE